jgi:hypothetical protein
MAKELFTRKQMENAVMIAGDLYQKFYNAASTPGGSLEVANVIIDEAVKMEKWLTEKYGEDDEEYLDRLDEYEAMLEKEYELPKMVGDGDNLPERLAELYEGMTYAQKDEFLRLTGNN